MVWNRDRQKVWENTKHFIADCYAMNVDEQDNLWYYYYDDFNLVKTDFDSEWVFRPDVKGSSSFLIMKSHMGIIMDSGYGKHGKMKMLRILGNRLGRPEDAGFVCNGDTVPMEMYCFRSARAAFADGGERLFCVEVV